MDFTTIILIITGLVSYQAFNNPSLMENLIFYPHAIDRNKEWYRFISSGFIHANWPHLIINMFVLYQFGPFVEIVFSSTFGEAMGRVVYILFYVSAIAIASTPTFFQYKESPYYRALGASGATSAVIFAYILFHPWDWFLYPPLPALLLGVGYLWYSSYMAKKGQDNIGHDAHFWGAVYGVAFILSVAILYRPELLNMIINELMSGPKPPPFF